MSCNEVSDYIQKQRIAISLSDESIDILSEKSSIDRITANIHVTLAAISTETIALSPLVTLGKDFISEQITKNGQQIIDNATGAIKQELDKVAKFDIRKTIENAQKQIYNAIAAAITADSDLSMVFLQRLAQKTVDSLNEKKKCLDDLKKKVTELHNYLKIMVTGGTFFNPYLEQLRAALKKIRSAQTKIDNVTSVYIANRRFLSTTFNNAKLDLEAAEKLITPANSTPTISQVGIDLLANVGIPSQPEQLTALISVPQKAQEVAFLATRYFLLVLQTNALLLAFETGYQAFTGSSSKLLDNYSISMLQSLSTKIGNLFEKMATSINGNPTALDKTDYARAPIGGVVSEVTPNFIAINSGVNSVEVTLKPNSILKVVPGEKVSIGQALAEYRPDSIKVATQTLGWVVELRAIIDYMGLIPGSTLANVQASQNVVDVYNASVVKLQTKNNRTQGTAVLVATAGREDVTDLQTQIQTLVLRSLRAIVDDKSAVGATALARTIITRIELSITQDKEIISILQTFIATQTSLKTTLPVIASSIKTALKNSGLDRAADMLDNGQYAEFFNLNSKTATYAGAALVGIAALKKCLANTEDQEQLTQAERVIQRDMKAKELLAQRTATSGFLQQKALNARQDQELSTIDSKAKVSCAKCGIITEFSADGLLRTVSNVMGLSSAGNSTLPKDMFNIGKGIL